MARRIIVKAVPSQKPEVGLYVLALIRLARQLEAEEQARQDQPADHDSAAGEVSK